MTTERITIFIEPLEAGFVVESDDLPGLNIFVEQEAQLTTAVPKAIKYLYKHNKGVDVQVFMQVPVFDVPRQEVPRETRRQVTLELAA